MKISIKTMLVLGALIQLNYNAFSQNTFPNSPSGSGNVGIGTLSPAVLLDVQNGDVKFNQLGEEISFARPAGENGFSLSSSLSKRADFRFDGVTLRMITSNSMSAPLNESGIAIATQTGWVGLGNNTPQARFHLKDKTKSDYGAIINTNSKGATLLVIRESTGSLTIPTFTSSDSYGSIVQNYYNSGAVNTIGGFFQGRGNTSAQRAIGVSSEADGNTTFTNYNLASTAYYGKGTNANDAFGAELHGTGLRTGTGAYCSGEVDPAFSGYADYYYGVQAFGTGYACQTHTFGVKAHANTGRYVYGIYGSATSSCEQDPIPFVYAGYFAGDVYSTGSYLPSDLQLKEKIQPLNGALSIISKLNPKKYYYKQSDEFLGAHLPKGERMGFIAQELEQILPNSVKSSHNPELKDKDNKTISSKAFDFKAVDYISLIPILVQGIKEQQAEIEELKLKLENKNNELSQNKTENLLDNAILYQNNPNPFNEGTSIRYHLNNKNDNASIIIFDMNGKLVKSYELDKNAIDGEIQITSNSIQPGMYYYSLVIKGVEVKTLKMIMAK